MFHVKQKKDCAVGAVLLLRFPATDPAVATAVDDRRPAARQAIFAKMCPFCAISNFRLKLRRFVLY